MNYNAGPDNVLPSTELTECLRNLGLTMRRFKTGTPARVRRDSINYDVLEVQEGDMPIVPFSFETPREGLENKVVCHIAYTNEKTHEIIRNNLHESAMYGGFVTGVGPRYCPSIEDKIVKFADK